ncbi:unnamed protein product [Closterium sp. NIES-64]|nr:unnamed protein product [Closterium sp. NIES-64]
MAESLKGQGLTGSIHSEISKLTTLTVLDLQSNRLEGKMDAFTANIKAPLVLKELSYNYLYGAFSSTLFALKTLSTLSLAFNYLTSCPYTPAFAPLYSPTLIHHAISSVAFNYLTGSLPTALPTMLASLDMQSNFLARSVAANSIAYCASIGNCLVDASKCASLGLPQRSAAECAISGSTNGQGTLCAAATTCRVAAAGAGVTTPPTSLSASLPLFCEAVSMDLVSTQTMLAIKAALGVTLADRAGTQGTCTLEGQTPGPGAWTGVYCSSTCIELSSNLFQHRLDVFLYAVSALKALKNIYLQYSWFSSSIPSSLVALSALSTLKLNRNYLTGTVPAFKTTLKTLNVASNLLSGAFPAISLTACDARSNCLSSATKCTNADGTAQRAASECRVCGSTDASAVLCEGGLCASDASAPAASSTPNTDGQPLLPLSCLGVPMDAAMGLTLLSVKASLGVTFTDWNVDAPCTLAGQAVVPGSWSSVVCDATGKVLTLELGNNLFSGRLDSFLTPLLPVNTLKVPKVQANYLTGSMPAALPASLKYLDASRNYLVGTVKASLGVSFTSWVVSSPCAMEGVAALPGAWSNVLCNSAFKPVSLSVNHSSHLSCLAHAAAAAKTELTSLLTLSSPPPSASPILPPLLSSPLLFPQLSSSLLISSELPTFPPMAWLLFSFISAHASPTTCLSPLNPLTSPMAATSTSTGSLGPSPLPLWPSPPSHHCETSLPSASHAFAAAAPLHSLLLPHCVFPASYLYTHFPPLSDTIILTLLSFPHILTPLTLPPVNGASYNYLYGPVPKLGTALKTINVQKNWLSGTFPGTGFLSCSASSNCLASTGACNTTGTTQCPLASCAVCDSPSGADPICAGGTCAPNNAAPLASSTTPTASSPILPRFCVGVPLNPSQATILLSVKTALGVTFTEWSASTLAVSLRAKSRGNGLKATGQQRLVESEAGRERVLLVAPPSGQARLCTIQGQTPMPGSWSGVFCSSAGVVVALYLSSNLFNQRLDSFVAPILPSTSLKELAVSFNWLYGSVPSKLVATAALSNLPFSYNYLTGSLPKPGATLKVLDTQANFLSGTFPTATLAACNARLNCFSDASACPNLDGTAQRPAAGCNMCGSITKTQPTLCGGGICLPIVPPSLAKVPNSAAAPTLPMTCAAVPLNATLHPPPLAPPRALPPAVAALLSLGAALGVRDTDWRNGSKCNIEGQSANPKSWPGVWCNANGTVLNM